MGDLTCPILSAVLNWCAVLYWYTLSPYMYVAEFWPTLLLISALLQNIVTIFPSILYIFPLSFGSIVFREKSEMH